MKKMIIKSAKIFSAALLAAVFLPVSSFAQPAGRVYATLDSSAYTGPQVTYDFGFFASLFIIIALGALLYILSRKTAAKKQ